jgi:6-phosphogluconolactonase
VDLIVAPLGELQTRITQAFEDLVRETLDRGRTLPNEPSSFGCGLTGGSTSLLFLGALRAANVDWARVVLCWCDQPAVPIDHPMSSTNRVREMLLERLAPAAPQFLHIPIEGLDVTNAARNYEAALMKHLVGAPLDLVVLGLGEDGHLAALFPGHPASTIEDRWTVGIDDAPTPPAHRVSMTMPCLLRAREIWVVAVGVRKLPILQRALSRQSESTPFDTIIRRASRLVLFTDQVVHSLGAPRKARRR